MLNYLNENIPIYVKCKVCKYFLYIIAIYFSNESQSHRERNKSVSILSSTIFPLHWECDLLLNLSHTHQYFVLL